MSVMKNILVLSLLICASLIARSQTNYWSKVTSGTQKRLLSVSFGSSAIGYISGADSVLLKTTDGGISWSSISHTGMQLTLAARDIVHVNFINATVGYAVVSSFQYPTYAGQLYKTTDGGSTWTGVTSGNIAAYRTFFFNENNGYQIGSAFFAGQTIIKLSSGTWGTEKNFSWGPDEFLYAIDFTDVNRGITGGSGGYVYRTSDAGAHWDTVKTNTDSAINGIQYINDSIILAATDDPMGGLIISKDTGRTWQYEPTTQSFVYPQFKSLVISKRDSFIAVGKASSGQGAILRYNNNMPDIAPADQILYEVTMVNDSIAYAVGDSGLILTNRKFLTNGIGSTMAEISAALYPNPTPGRFTTEMKEAHSISVYDMSGRCIFHSRTQAKKHDVDLRGHTPGLYLAEIQLKNGRPIHKKVLVGK
jgi:photosystem II stability/assembly factor-like uncharacterized protein